MAAGIKRLAKETAIYGLSSILGRFLNWMLVPMYTRVLVDTSQYGIVTNLYGWTALFFVILTYGMETGFFRFINKKEETAPLRIYSSTLYSIIFTSSLFIISTLFFLEPISGVLGYRSNPEYIGFMACIVAVDSICSIPFAFLRYKNKALRFSGIKLLSIFLNIFLNIFFLIICPKINATNPEWISSFYNPEHGVGYIFTANILTTFITFLLLIPDMTPGLCAKPDFKRLKAMLRYSFPILILGVAGIFNHTADKILFPFLFEDKNYAASQLGIYGACFKIAVSMVMFIQAFRYAYEPFIFAKNKEGDNKKSYIEAMKYFICFALVIFLGIVFFLDILKFFVDPSYFPGLKIVPVVMLGEFFFGIYFNLSIWYKLTDQTKWGAYFSIIGCMTTVAAILTFVPRYGFMACAWASFASNLLMMLLSYFIGQKKYPIAYNLRSAFFYGSLALVCYVVGTFPEIEPMTLRLSYRGLILLIFIGIIIKKDIPLSEIPYLKRYYRK